MEFKAEIRFGVKDKAGDDLILPNDVLKKAALEYQARIRSSAVAVTDVEARDDTLVVTLSTFNTAAGKRLGQLIKSDGVKVVLEGVVRKSEPDESGFPIVREFDLRSISVVPK